jgi:hypothetical protein
MDRLLQKNSVEEKIRENRVLLVSGPDAMLSTLPPGNWIGGTTPYFMGDEGAFFSNEAVCVTDLSRVAKNTVISAYDETNIHYVFDDAMPNGFSIIIIPFKSKPHFRFAIGAPDFSNFAMRQLIRWVCGGDINEIDRLRPKAFDGHEGHEEKAVVMHVEMPEGMSAEIGIVSPFRQGHGHALTFESDGFIQSHVMVDGVLEHFPSYVRRTKMDTRLPLVADYAKAMINVCIGQVDDEKVTFLAPVFKNVAYKQAKPLEDYVLAFERVMPDIDASGIAFSCNSVLNYIDLGMAGKKIGPFKGPVTFGEVAYQLLNQTLVYLHIQKQNE